MPIHHTQLFFKFPLNVSVQEGDYAYFARNVNASQSGSGTQFQINNGDMHETTLVNFVSASSIVCKFNCQNAATDCLAFIPDVDDFIMFSKDNAANMASILGYYAEVEMVNDSNEKAKLFAVSAGVIESSK